MPNSTLASTLQLLLTILRISLVIWLGFGLLLFLTQSRYVYAPSKEITATPADAGLAFEAITLTTSDAERLLAWHVPGPTNARGSVIICHGNAGNIGDRLPLLAALHKLGMSALIFDYRGFGASTGKPSEKGTYLDARAAWDWLVGQRRTQPGKIIIMGRSLGGAVASRLAAEINPAGLVIESSFSSLPDLAAALYPLWPARLMCRFRYDNIGNIKNIRAPVLVAHSPDDEMIPFAHGRRIFDSANEPRQFVALKGSHNAGEIMDDIEYLKTLDAFFYTCLGR